MTTLWAAAVLLGQTASAQPEGSGAKGVLVRLEPSGHTVTDAPLVVLTPSEGGDPVEITLNDNGSPPDVAADDGRWAGVAMSGHSSFSVLLTVDGQPLDAGQVEWPDDGNARDLVLTLTGDSVTAQASSPDLNLAPNSPGDGGPSAASGGPTGAATIPPAAQQGGGLPPLDNSGSTAADDGWLWVALGLGALCLVGGLLLVLGGGRTRRSAPALERAPEPPVFGPGTPALDRGLSVWQVEPSERDRFLTGLVGALARNHRVLLLLSDQAAVPTVFGGPVYVCRETDAKRIESHLADVEEQPGLPLVVVVVADRPDTTLVDALTEMMDPDPGGILVASEPPDGRTADITVVVEGTTAALTTSRGVVALAETPHGYAVSSS